MYPDAVIHGNRRNTLKESRHTLNSLTELCSALGQLVRKPRT